MPLMLVLFHLAAAAMPFSRDDREPPRRGGGLRVPALARAPARRVTNARARRPR
jgi:hypothetical protein